MQRSSYCTGGGATSATSGLPSSGKETSGDTDARLLPQLRSVFCQGTVLLVFIFNFSCKKLSKVFKVLSLKILHQHWLLGLNTKPGISRGSSMNIFQQHLFGATQCPTTNVPHTEPHSVRRRRPMTCGGQCTIQGGALAL